MNYYPFHIGDYAAHTAHLEPLEDLAYRRMLDAYYLREGPLPADPTEIARLIRMRQHLAEVESALNEFFHLAPDGWRHTRCDEEIDCMRDKKESSEEKSAHERERMRRHRERRAELFDGLRTAGITPAWDVSIAELQRLHDKYCNSHNDEPVTNLKREQSISGDAPATAIPIPTPIPNISKPNGLDIGARKSRPTRKCPPDFEITPEMRAWAAANAGLASIDAATEAFRDHTFKNAISDWSGAWRNWMRRDHQYAQEKQKGPSRRAPVRENFDAINYGEGISPL